MATEAVVPSLLDSEQIVRVPFGSDFKGTDTVTFKYTFGTVIPKLALVSDEKATMCKRMLYSDNVGTMTAIFVDALFPLKVMLLFMPLGLVLLMLGAQLSWYIGRPALLLVAAGAIGTDLAFFAGSAIFPVCSILTTGRGFGIDGAVGLVVYYVGFFYVFKYADSMLSQQCPIPPQLRAMHLPGVLASGQAMLPSWLRIGPACIVVYVWAMVYLVMGLVATEVALPFICLAVNGVVAGIVLPHLKGAIADARKANGAAGFWRGCFVLQLLEPVVALVLFLTVDLKSAVLVCIAAVAIGGAYGYKTSRDLAAAAVKKARPAEEYKIAPEQRIKAMRPKQRALLEAQLAATAAKKAKSTEEVQRQSREGRQSSKYGKSQPQ